MKSAATMEIRRREGSSTQQLVTVHPTSPGATRRAAQALLDDKNRLRGPAIDVEKLVQAGRNRRG